MAVLKNKLILNNLLINDVYFLISSISFFLISHFCGNNSSYSALALTSFYCLYAAVVFYNRNTFREIKNLNIISFLLSLLFLFATEPILENDHYRYLWEGKVLSEGLWPYFHAPDSSLLNHIVFSHKDKIGYPSLTTVYPPIALFWFTLSSFVFESYENSLTLLMLMNGVLVLFLIRRLHAVLNNYWGLVLLYPFLIKEFIQSVHIDLLAFIFVFLFLLRPRSFYHSCLLISLSIFTKFIGVLVLAPLLIREIRNKHLFKRFFLIFLMILMIVIYFYILYVNDGLSGFKAFYQYWAWNPGLFSILWRWFGISNEISRLICQIAFALYFLYVTVTLVRLSHINQTVVVGYTYLIFSGLMYFTPVYNSWYAIWFAVPALMLNLNYGVVYAYLSFLGYISYYNKDLLIFTEFLSHLLFFPSFIHCKKIILHQQSCYKD